MGMAAVLVGAAPAMVHPSFASWTSDNCTKGFSADSNVKRSEAQAYAAGAFNEGYEWGGGCWNDNNYDDTPGQPDSNGEGPDCSGYTFKTWELQNTFGASGFTFWNKLHNVHGPYTAASFHSPSSGWPFFKLADKNRLTTLYMDAFASTTHIGMLYTSVNPSPNTDWIAEAYSDAVGTQDDERGYRYDSTYVGVQRHDWTPDCFPNCGSSSRHHPVVMP